jgi:hypothetical protein
MAINKWVNSTLNTSTGASPRASAVAGTADALNATIAWDSAVITTMDQLRVCVSAMLQQAAGQLTGP